MEESEKKDVVRTRGEAKRFPSRHKLPPAGPDYTLRLELLKAKKTLAFTIRASADSRALEIKFSGREVASEEFFGERLEARAKDGEVVSHFIQNFGVYGEERTYELKTPQGSATLLLRRSGDGDLSVWLKGYDLSGAESRENPTKRYVSAHIIDGKTVGYTIKEFLEHVNLSFANVLCNIQLE